MKAFIEVRRNHEVLHIKELNENKISIGRDYNNHLYLHDENISRFHGLIGFDSGQYFYEDTSSNGTLFNNRKIKSKKMYLNHGDIIQLASYKIIFSEVPILDKIGNYDFNTKLEQVNTSTDQDDNFSLIELETEKKIQIRSLYFSIGAHEMNQYCLNRSDIATHHISIFIFNVAPYLESHHDQTFINEKQIIKNSERILLHDDDLIRIGSVKFKFKIAYKTVCQFGISTRSPNMKELLQDIQVVAKTNLPVLILGETGTGKELLSRAIHATSDRRDKPFVSINCGALTKNLAESSLFGHIKGSFTDAKRNHVGHFMEANHGTIFLDEIGELEPEIQIKLLRTIEYQCIRPQGAQEDTKINVRVIAATNKMLCHDDIRRELKFRDDFYHRLSIFTLKIPSLKDRKEDIPMLMDHFLNEFIKNERYEISNKKHFSTISYEYAKNYDWPGNIRELRNRCLQSIVFSDGDTVDLDIDYLKIERNSHPLRYFQRKIRQMPEKLLNFLKIKQKCLQEHGKFIQDELITNLGVSRASYFRYEKNLEEIFTKKEQGYFLERYPINEILIEAEINSAKIN